MKDPATMERGTRASLFPRQFSNTRHSNISTNQSRIARFPRRQSPLESRRSVKFRYFITARELKTPGLPYRYNLLIIRKLLVIFRKRNCSRRIDRSYQHSYRRRRLSGGIPFIFITQESRVVCQYCTFAIGRIRRRRRERELVCRGSQMKFNGKDLAYMSIDRRCIRAKCMKTRATARTAAANPVDRHSTFH